MRKTTLPALAGALLFAVSAGASAQTREGPLPPVASSGFLTASAQSMPLPPTVVGKNLYMNRNDVAGTITGLHGDALIVSVGPYLEKGERIVVVPRERVFLTGAGPDSKVGTLMSKDDLSAMPNYTPAPKESASSIRR